MSKTLENLKKTIENEMRNIPKKESIQEDISLLMEFYNNADSNMKKFIDTLLRFHQAYPDKTIKEVSAAIRIGKIDSENCFESFLDSYILQPSVLFGNYKKEPMLFIKDRHSCVVGFNLTDIEVIVHAARPNESGGLYYIQLHSNHNNIDYQVVIRYKEGG